MNERTETIIMIVVVVLILIATFVLEHYAIMNQMTKGWGY
jgi:hypothetical protein